jgi:hypothetical protein
VGLGGVRAAILILLSLALLLDAQTIEPQILLNKVRQNVAATVRQAPRYTCTETIERFWYANRKVVRPGCDTARPPEVKQRNLLRSDRLRLDVAVGAGQEIFAWHGQKRFQTEEIDKLVTDGPISSGNYFSFLSSIFLEGVAKIDFRTFANEGDHRLAVFGYAVPIGESRFTTRTDSGSDVMGYHGKFTVDVPKGALEQLEILTDDMPESAHVCAFDMKTDYKVTLLKGIPFELPASVAMDVLSPSHERSNTVTEYHDCHEFQAESVLRFDAPPKATTPQVPMPARSLPVGISLRIRLKSNVAVDSAWAGDPIEGELEEDVIDPAGQVLIPERTSVQGFLLRVETVFKPLHSHQISLQFRELHFAGEEYQLHLKSQPEPVAVDERATEMPRRIQLENPPISDDPQACRFRLNDKKVKLRGVVTYWITE